MRGRKKKAAGRSKDLLSDPSLVAWIQRHTGGKPDDDDRLQSLWGGYGEIVRVHLSGSDVSSVIVKQVNPPAQMKLRRGSPEHASHQRKLRSYDVERAFYSEWSDRTPASCRTPRCYAADKTGAGWRFLLEDLDASGFAGRLAHLDGVQIAHCLRWLASFHASFLGETPKGLWKTGTYWHLATRAVELAALTDPQLKAAARPLDAALNTCRFQTFVHGDAKTENFCFGADGVAAVDFQYVGGGCGMKDVAYFLSSCLSDAQCQAEAPYHLDTYFSFLRQYVEASVDIDALEEEWRRLYPAAWADFHRFLAGWAPGHWPIHSYTRQMTQEALPE